MKVLTSQLCGSLGVGVRRGLVRVVARSNFAAYSIAELDQGQSTSINAIAGDSRSSLVRVVKPTPLGIVGARAHLIVQQALSVGQTGFAALGGRTRLRVSGATYGNGITVGSTEAGARIRGIVIDVIDSDYAEVLWNGSHGFGQVEPPSGGNTPPVADIVAPVDTGIAPVALDFDASASSDADGSIVKYEFNFDDADGWVNNGTDPTITRTFYYGGIYDVAVRVTDDGGLTDTASVRVTLQDPSGGPTLDSMSEDTHGDSGNEDEGSAVEIVPG